jgi:hypothetical protein
VALVHTGFECFEDGEHRQPVRRWRHPDDRRERCSSRLSRAGTSSVVRPS